MQFLELDPADISALDDGSLRELVARLCEAEIIQRGGQRSAVTWGGAQEAADGGVDVNVASVPLERANFVPRPHTAFQVKKHGMSRAACKKEMQDNGALKPVIADLAAEHGAYIIVSGKDDCSERMLRERVLGMTEALSDLQNHGAIALDFYGRDRLCSWLRQHPGVVLWARARVGKTLAGWMPFGRWANTPTGQEDQFLADDHPCVTDLNAASKAPVTIAQGIQLVRDKLRPAGGTVRITGLSGVGKTRFAQALFEDDVGEAALPESEVVYADLGCQLTPTASELAASLIANVLSAYLILDNCPSDIHRQLRTQITASRATLHLLTIEYDISDDRPEETEVIHIEPASESTISTLVQNRFPELEQVNTDRIAAFSGGNARVALALASRVKMDETLSNFSDEDLFQRLFSQRKGSTQGLFAGAEILALVYSFNISRAEFNDELATLGAIAGINRQTLYQNNAELLRRQLAQKRGDWRAVLPQALANRLAKRALENIAPEDINAELLKPENSRLLKSCAHRLGYLHDVEPARQLAGSWTLPGGPLADITACDAATLAIFDYIAPVFPDTVLTLIENAASDATFASRANSNFNVFVRLLCQLAYEDASFDRATAILLKFAESEHRDERNNSIVGHLTQLFAIHLSGTHATPVRRMAFVAKLIATGNPRHLEIASACMRAACEAAHWTSTASFSFGARQRDYGWQPQTRADVLAWYSGFVGTVEPYLRDADYAMQRWAKTVLASHFRSLWSFAGCHDLLENVVRNHASGGGWREMWIALKNTIRYDGKDGPSNVATRLEAMLQLSAPSDPYAEIEAYALSDTWDLVDYLDGDYTEREKEISQKLVTLGELAAAEPRYIERLGGRLWEKHITSLLPFGRGLASGSVHPRDTFELLVGTLQRHPPASLHPLVLMGYFQGVYARDTGLARQLQENVLHIPELRPHFIYLLGANPIEPWGIDTLIQMARSGDFEAWRFQQIRYNRTISDRDLGAILSAIGMLECGALTVLNILSMRFLRTAESDYHPSDALRAISRDAVLGLMAMHRDAFSNTNFYEITRVCEVCLDGAAPASAVTAIVDALCDGLQRYRLSGFELADIIKILLKGFPEIVLDRVFKDPDEARSLVFHMFRDRSGRDETALNAVDINRLVAWCGGRQERIRQLASATNPFTAADAETSPMDHPKNVVLSDHMKVWLEAADDKPAIVGVMFATARPTSWSGSLADILQVRSEALAELAAHPRRDVRIAAEQKLSVLRQHIQAERKREADENTRREQRFE